MPMSKRKLFQLYGYLMDKSHGKDVDLLIDILKCTGVGVTKLPDGKYFVDKEDF